MLAEHFLQMYAEKYKKPNAQFSQNAYNQMLNYMWRGNVRELEHAIERAVLLCRGGKIESMDLLQANGTAVSSDFRRSSLLRLPHRWVGSAETARALVEECLRFLQ